MKDYFYRKAWETEQKQYLAKSGRKYLFLSDYFDILAIGGGLLLCWFLSKHQTSTDGLIFLLLSYGTAAVIIRSKVKKRQRAKLAFLCSYEQTREQYFSAWEKMNSSELKKKFADIFNQAGRSVARDESEAQDEEYSILMLANKEEIINLRDKQLPAKALLILPVIKRTENRLLRENVCGEAMIADWEDIFDLALQSKQIALPSFKANFTEKNWGLRTGYLPLYGVLLLFLAEISRYFYLYFFGGIFLLSLFLVSFQKKSRTNELVFLKKKLKSVKMKASY